MIFVSDFKCRGGWTQNNTKYFLVSFVEKFNYEYCITYDMESSEIRLVRNSHFCYREDQPPDHANVDNYFGIPKVYDHSFNDDLVTFTLINEGMQMTFSILNQLNHFYFFWCQAYVINGRVNYGELSTTFLLLCST